MCFLYVCDGVLVSEGIGFIKTASDNNLSREFQEIFVTATAYRFPRSLFYLYITLLSISSDAAIKTRRTT
jgi:hypothetical protein